MKRRSILVLVYMVFLLTAISTRAGVTPSFQGLGDLPGGIFQSEAYGISGDGSTVAGVAASDGLKAVRWRNGQIEYLGDLPGGFEQSRAFGVSYDGSVIVGDSTIINNDFRAFRWESGKMLDLGITSSMVESSATAVSGNGGTVVGHELTSAYRTKAFRWSNGTMYVLSGSRESEARDISSDGTVIAGNTDHFGYWKACIWENGVIKDLGGLMASSWAYGISPDGSAVVGEAPSPRYNGNEEAFLWTKKTGMIGLGVLPGLPAYSMARDASMYGEYIVGSCGMNKDREAFIWDEKNGMRSIKDLLEDCNLNLDGWRLTSAVGISNDGIRIVGDGINPDGNTEAWIATIPEPATILLFGLGALILRQRNR